jgi:hypothetical protein
MEFRRNIPHISHLGSSGKQIYFFLKRKQAKNHGHHGRVYFYQKLLQQSTLIGVF